MMVDTKPTIELDFAYDQDQSLEDALRDFYFDHGLTGRIEHRVVIERGPGGGWPLLQFTAEDADALYELGTAYGLEADDPRLNPLADGPCQHPSTHSTDGVWTCDECDEDTTLQSLEGLLDSVLEILKQAEAAGVAEPHQMASRVLEASVWMRGATEAAKVIADRSSPWPKAN